MKKMLKVISLLAISLLAVACSNENSKTSSAKNEIPKETQEKYNDGTLRRFEDMGVEIEIPSKVKSLAQNIDIYGNTTDGEDINKQKSNSTLAGDVTISYIYKSTMDKAKKLDKEANKIDPKDKEKISKASEEIMNLTNEFEELFKIAVIDTKKSDKKAEEELFSKYDNVEEIGKDNNLKFYFLSIDINKKNISKEHLEEYKKVYDELNNFKKSIKVFTPITTSDKLRAYKNINFNAKTLDGKDISSDIFKDYDLTLVNLWGTFCDPCIAEMPDINKLYEEFKDKNVNVIGIVGDTPNKDNEELARKIIKNEKVTYTNIIPDKSLEEGIIKEVSGYPTTFFVDKNGNVIGETIVGGNDYDLFKSELVKRLEMIK